MNEPQIFFWLTNLHVLLVEEHAVPCSFQVKPVFHKRLSEEAKAAALEMRKRSSVGPRFQAEDPTTPQARCAYIDFFRD